MAAGSGVGAAAAPFILTLELDGESFAALDALRRRFYAPERNMVPAHVTLFRTLPGDRGREIKMLLAKTVEGERPFDITIGEAKATERGVAFFLQSPRLHALRDRLADEWGPWLGEQDRHGFRPHVTIQSNVGEAEARRTIVSVAAHRVSRRARGVGLHLWRYREGPWTSERLFRFG